MPAPNYQNFELYARKLEELQRRRRRFPTREERLAEGEAFEAATQHHGGEELVRQRLRKRAEYLRKDPKSAQHVLDYHAGVPGAADRLIRAHGGFIRKMAQGFAKRAHSRMLDAEDFEQEGREGMHRALMDFDYHRGNKFLTFARWWVRQRMSRARDSSHQIHIPVDVQREHRNYFRAKRKLTQEQGRTPTTYDMARYLGMSVARAVELEVLKTAPPASFDERLHDMEQLLEKASDSEQVLARVRQHIRRLPPRQREAISLYYGIDYPEHTLEQLGAELGVSRERARQLKFEAIQLLRQHMGLPRKYRR